MHDYTKRFRPSDGHDSTYLMTDKKIYGYFKLSKFKTLIFLYRASLVFANLFPFQQEILVAMRFIRKNYLK